MAWTNGGNLMSSFIGANRLWGYLTNEGRTSIATNVNPTNLITNLDFGVSACYPGTGTTFTDLSTNANNGSVNQAVYSSTAANGYGSFLFDGVDDTMNTAKSNIAVNTFTMSAWCRPTATHQVDDENTGGVDGTSGQKYLFGAGLVGNFAQLMSGAGVSVGTNGIGVYEHAGSYMPCLASYSGTLSSTSFSHVVVTYTSLTPRIYLNGVLVRTGLTSTRTNGVYLTSSQIAFGAYGYFQGSIAVVRYFSTALSGEQIAREYNAYRWRFGV
jgi:hypothetical protein